MPRKVHQVARGRQHVLAAPRHFAPDIGQHHLARPALHHLDAQRPFEVAYLHRQRRLGDVAGLGRAAEMAVFGERGEIAELAERDHGSSDKLIGGEDNSTGPDLRILQSLVTKSIRVSAKLAEEFGRQ